MLSRVDATSTFEGLVSGATGLDVTVKGSAVIGLFPTPHIALKEVVLKNSEIQIVSVGETDIGLAFWPLLHKQIRIKRLVLHDVLVEFERDRSGRLNFLKASQTGRQVPAMGLGHLSLVKASFRYINRQSDSRFTATDCAVESSNLQLADGDSADFMEHLSLSARGTCVESRNDSFVGAHVSFSVTGERGMFTVVPLTMQIMGGNGSGHIEADFTGNTPAYRVHYAVAQLHVDDLFKFLAPGKVGEGRLDFAADLSMRGRDAAELTRTTQGTATLRGKNLLIAMGNLDEKLAHYESSQNFNLVDVGAFLIAGPLGTAATKGRDFAAVFQGTKGNTDIRLLVSQWQVDNGVAVAQDVAMATRENRLAMKGGLDFVNRSFNEVTVAILDHQGCARVAQRVHGSFSNPEIEKPNVLASLTGPVGSLLGKARKLMGGKCEVFYEGAVPP
jgi:AsmA protein